MPGGRFVRAGDDGPALAFHRPTYPGPDRPASTASDSPAREAATAMRDRFTGLWRHHDFLKLWGGQTVSLIGSQVTFLALPLLAALTLDATPTELGVLLAAETAPVFFFGLVAGVWADRVRRRPILIAADLGRGVLLLAIPLAAWGGVLRIELLYAVSLLVGTLTVFFDVSYEAFLPAIVRRDQLLEGNSKLETSFSTAELAGPGIGGWLVALVGAPLPILLDAASFLVSAVALGAIRAREPAPASPAERAHLRREIGEGMRALLGHPLLRPMMGLGTTANLLSELRHVVLILFATRELGLGPGLIGLVFALGSVGGLLGAALTDRLTDRFPIGRVLLGSALGMSVSFVVVALAGGSPPVATAVLAAALFVDALAQTIGAVTVRSTRQAVTPAHLLGRVGGSSRFLTWGLLPLGALLGGALGQAIGLRPTLWIGAVASLGAAAWVWLSPLRGLRELPAPPDEATEPMAVVPVETLPPTHPEPLPVAGIGRVPVDPG